MKTDPDMAKKIVAAWGTGKGWSIWGASEYLRAVGLEGESLTPGLLWLIQHGEAPVIRPDESGGLPEWLWAASVLGLTKDERFGDALVSRLGSVQASSYWFVTALGNLRVKKAVPYIVEWLHHEGSWVVYSQAWGADVNYLLPTLCSITGKDFFAGVSPDEGMAGKYVEKRSEILRAIDLWWSTEGLELYGPKRSAMDPRKSDNKPIQATPDGAPNG
jgi:hypothetical protein